MKKLTDLNKTRVKLLMEVDPVCLDILNKFIIGAKDYSLTLQVIYDRIEKTPEAYERYFFGFNFGNHLQVLNIFLGDYTELNELLNELKERREEISNLM